MSDPIAAQPTAPIVEHTDIMYPSAIPFVLVHLACVAALWTGVTYEAVVLCFLLYWLRIFAIGAGYHRYFSHRAYRTSRAFQFALAVLSQSTAQKSVLWWASKHRHHHLHSDTETDVHSPRHTGFVYSHLGWIFSRKNDAADLVKVADFARYPELMWLHKHELVPPVVLACCRSSSPAGPALWSASSGARCSSITRPSASIRWRMCAAAGAMSPVTTSRNNWLLALFTMGEGWHNNHHAYQSSVRQGFRWWEIDATFYLLKALSWTGLVWDLKTPPAAVRLNEYRLGSRVIERAAAQLAGSFDTELIVRAIASAYAGSGLPTIQDKLAQAQNRATDALAGLHLPQLPTRHEIVSRAMAMFAETPSMEAIVNRAQGVILDTICARLGAMTLGQASALPAPG